jgi:hypothetical protein
MSSKPSWGPHSPTRHHAGQLPSADVPLWRLLRKLVAVRTTATVRLLRRSRKARSRAAVGLAAVLLAAGTVYVCVRLPSASAARILTTRASPPEGQRRAGGGDARPQDLDSVLRLGGRSRSRFAGASEPVGGADAVSGPGSASAGDAAGLGTPRGRATAEADGGAAGIVDGIVDELRSRGEGEAGYAEQLRRRAAELSVEISRFKGRAAPQSKQERLQMAARVLSTQLTALKQRAGALTLGVGGSALGVGGSGFDQAMASGRAVGGGAVGGGGKRAGAAGGGSAGGAARSMAAGSAAGGGAHSALGDGATGGLTGNGAVGTAAGSAAGGLAGGAAEAASDGVADTGGWGWRDLPSQEPTGRASTADAPLSHESTGRASTDDALCGGVRHPDFRIAMIIPWLDGGVGEAAHPPAWFPHLAATAAHSALLVDWIILHEGSLSLPPATRPPNVRLFDLHPDGIARLFSSRLSGTLSLAREEARAVEQRMMLMFGKWPRLVAEYKPAYGEIFSQWLGNYTHWGYTDFDTIVGQLPRFIERSELTEHHIVTYSFGDTDAVYLRGQWTVHRNSAGVRMVTYCIGRRPRLGKHEKGSCGFIFEALQTNQDCMAHRERQGTRMPQNWSWGRQGRVGRGRPALRHECQQRGHSPPRSAPVVRDTTNRLQG